MLLEVGSRFGQEAAAAALSASSSAGGPKEKSGAETRVEGGVGEMGAARRFGVETPCLAVPEAQRTTNPSVFSFESIPLGGFKGRPKGTGPSFRGVVPKQRQP